MQCCWYANCCRHQFYLLYLHFYLRRPARPGDSREVYVFGQCYNVAMFSPLPQWKNGCSYRYKSVRIDRHIEIKLLSLPDGSPFSGARAEICCVRHCLLLLFFSVNNGEDGTTVKMVPCWVGHGVHLHLRLWVYFTSDCLCTGSCFLECS